MNSRICIRWSCGQTRHTKSKSTTRKSNRVLLRKIGISFLQKRSRIPRPRSQRIGTTGRKSTILKTQKLRCVYNWLSCSVQKSLQYLKKKVVLRLESNGALTLYLGLGQTWEHSRPWCQETRRLGWRHGRRMGTCHDPQPRVQGTKRQS